MITGTPRLNLIFLVLWRKVYIAARAPIEPPIIERHNSVPSDMRHFCNLAFRLSMAKTIKVMRLIKDKYKINTLIVIKF